MSSLDTASARIVIAEGTANEVTLELFNRDFALLEADVSLTVGANAQRLSVKALDQSGRAWRKVVFGRTATAYLQGTAVFSGIIAMPRVDTLGAAVLVEFDAVGRTQVLYSKKIAADATYDNKKTAYIAKQVIDGHFAGTLTTTNIDDTLGETLSEFTVTEGENVGQVIERLSKLDGYSFFVDVDDDVHYYAVSASSQATIYEEDLLGDAGEHFVESGVVPPKNVVRVRGGSGYFGKTKQESRNSYVTLDAPSDYVAQQFVAETARLSAFEFYMNRTTGSNQPGSAQVEIYASGYNECPSATLSTSVTAGSLTNVNNANDDNDSTYAGVQIDANQTAYFTFDMGTARNIRACRMRYSEHNGLTGGTNFPAVTFEYSDDGAAWSTAGSRAAHLAFSGIIERYTFWTASSHRYWRIKLQPGGSGMNNSLYCVEFLSDRALTTNRSWPLLDSTYKVEWSDDYSISASDVPTTPAYHAQKVWTTPKLVLTDGAAYWFVIKGSSDASGTKYWQVGQYTTSDAYTSGRTATSTDSGSTWSHTSYDLTFRLYWTSGEIDVIDTDAASVAAYGEWYHEEVLTDISSQEEAEYIASAILARYAEPGTRMTLPLKRVRPELTPKQVITVVRPLLDINETATVVEIRHTIRPQRANTVIVTGVLPYSGARAVEELRKVV